MLLVFTFACVAYRTHADTEAEEEPILGVTDEEGEGSGPFARQNSDPKHDEGIKHITPRLREAASRVNSVDEALYEFVYAMFCDRLSEVGLLDHPLVAGELATNDLLDQR